MLNPLVYLTKSDIPFQAAQVVIHQPTLKEIGIMGENEFFIGCRILTISKDDINTEEVDKQDLLRLSNFEIFMTTVQDKSPIARRNAVYAQMVLVLLFPEYKVFFGKNAIFLLSNSSQQNKPETKYIDQKNFDEFQQLIHQMFCLKDLFGQQDSYNPGNARAQALVEKFKKRRQKLAKLKEQQDSGQTIAILSRYISILAVGENKDMNELCQYTVYQICDEFSRFILKQKSDIYMQAKMAGAKDLKEVDDWMKDLHSK